MPESEQLRRLAAITGKQDLSGPFEEGRIAVLPFLNIGHSPDDEYFADGMTEQMISAISNIRSLKVISRTSMMQYKNTTRTIAEIGRDLKSRILLEGSVRKVGDRVRVTVKLVDAAEDVHLWAESYNRTIDDIFAVQTDIAENVVSAMKVQVLAREESELKKKPTDNIEAYTLFLKGRYLWNKRSSEGLSKSVDFFLEAIRMDSKFALAYSGIADSYFQIAKHGYANPPEAYEKARDAAMRALEINDDLVEARTTLAGLLADYEWNWKEAEREFRRVLQINPNYSTAHLWYGTVLFHEARLDEALSEVLKARDIDPLVPQIITMLGNIYEAMGEHEKAISHHRKALEIDPTFIPARMNLAELYVINSMYENAKAEVQKIMQFTSVNAPFRLFLAFIEVKEGRKEVAKAALEDFLKGPEERKYVPPELIVILYNVLGDTAKAFEWLEKSVDMHSPFVLDMKTSRMTENLRSDPRYAALLKKMGLE